MFFTFTPEPRLLHAVLTQVVIDLWLKTWKIRLIFGSVSLYKMFTSCLPYLFCLTFVPYPLMYFFFIA